MHRTIGVSRCMFKVPLFPNGPGERAGSGGDPRCRLPLTLTPPGGLSLTQEMWQLYRVRGRDAVA